MKSRDECTTCIKRRVRCDGLKPNCKRCQHAHRMCIFPDSSTKSFVFVGADSRSKKSVKKPKQDLRRDAITNTTSVKALQRVQWHSSPSNALAPSLADQATAYYFHAHHGGTLDLIEPAVEHAALLPDAFARAAGASSLQLALQARSHAAFGKARREARSSRESNALYLQAIRKLQHSLLDPVEAASDEVLLATMVLSSYENTRVFNDHDGVWELASAFALSQRLLQGFGHHNGATALLKLRSRHPASPNDLNLDKLVRRQILRSALLQGNGIPDYLEFGEYFGETGVTLGLDRHMAQLIKGQRYTRLMRNYYLVAQEKGQPLNKEPLSALIREAQRLDDDMSIWTCNLGPDWAYESVPDSNAERQNESYQAALHSYKGPGYAAIWNRHRAVRVILKKVRIELLTLAGDFFGADDRLTVKLMANDMGCLIDEICAGSLFLYGRCQRHDRPEAGHTGYAEKTMNATMLAHLAFPLHAVIDALPFTNILAPQERWIRDCLHEVGRSGNDTILEQIALQHKRK